MLRTLWHASGRLRHLLRKGSHVTSRHLASPHVTSRHLTSPHVTSRHVTSRHLTSPYLTSRHVTSRHLTSRHLASPHVTSPHRTSPSVTSRNVTSQSHQLSITSATKLTNGPKTCLFAASSHRSCDVFKRIPHPLSITHCTMSFRPDSS